jgi:hypothetical protein
VTVSVGLKLEQSEVVQFARWTVLFDSFLAASSSNDSSSFGLDRVDVAFDLDCPVVMIVDIRIRQEWGFLFFERWYDRRLDSFDGFLDFNSVIIVIIIINANDDSSSFWRRSPDFGLPNSVGNKSFLRFSLCNHIGLFKRFVCTTVEFGEPWSSAAMGSATNFQGRREKV